MQEHMKIQGKVYVTCNYCNTAFKIQVFSSNGTCYVLQVYNYIALMGNIMC